MADVVSKAQLQLDAGSLKAEAADAAAELEKLRRVLQSDRGELSEMEKALRALRSASEVNTDAVDALKSRIQAQKDAIANAQAQYIALGGSFSDIRQRSNGLKDQLNALQQELQALRSGAALPEGSTDPLKASDQLDRINKLQATLEREQSRLSAYRAELEAVGGTAEVSAQRISLLQQAVSEKEGSIAALQAELSQLGGAAVPTTPARTPAEPVSATEQLAAIERLRAEITATQAEVQRYEAALAEASSAARVNTAQVDLLGRAAGEKRAALAQLEAQLRELGGTMETSTAQGGRFGATLSTLGTQVQALPGPLGALAKAFTSLGSSVGGLAVAGGILAIVAATVALTAATAAATKSLAEYGVAQADARRSELLRLEGLTSTQLWMRSGAASARELQSAIDDVSSASPLPRSQVVGFATELEQVGAKAKSIPGALEAISLAAASGNQRYLDLVKAQAKGLAQTGQDLEGFADRVRARVGPVVEAQMLSFNVQATKLQENFARLFAGLNIDPLLKGIKLVLDLFGQSSAAGHALGTVISALFQPLIDAVQYIAPVVRDFFEGMTIGILKISIAILDLQIWFLETFGTGLISRIGGVTGALRWGELAVYGLAAAVAAGAVVMGTLTVALGALLLPVLISAAASVWALTWPVLAVVAGLTAVGVAVAAVMGAFGEIDWGGLATGVLEGIGGALSDAALWFLSIDWVGLAGSVISAIAYGIGASAGFVVGGLARVADAAAEAFVNTDWRGVFLSIDWMGIGTAIVQGIVSGLTGSLTLLYDGVTGLAGGLIDGFKAALGISSPSTVFAALGAELPAGAAVGVRGGAGEVNQASRELAGGASQAFSSALQAPQLPSPVEAVNQGVFEQSNGAQTEQSTGGSTPAQRTDVTARAGDRDAAARDQAPTVNIELLNVYAKDGATGESIAQEIKAELQRVLTTLVLARGGAVG